MINFQKSQQKICLTIILMLVNTIVFSQIKVKGKITDIQGNGVPAVSVTLKDSKIGVFADNDGRYEITIPREIIKPILNFSFMGYQPLTEVVGTRTNIDVVLLEDVSSLEEVVVVGYGTQRKGSITGAVSSISGKDLVRAPVADITNSLAGRLPGIRSVNRSGQPGYSGSELDVRGFGNALVIVDGIPGGFSQLDPNEIESISVLKDASAAVYGVRAANGVILVTTKKGKSGITRINFTLNTGWQTPTKYPNLVNAGEFAELIDENAMNVAFVNNTEPKPIYGKEEVEKWKNEVDPEHKSTDWYDEAFRKYAPQQQYNVNISGGKDSLKYFASVGYFNQGSMWRTGHTKFDRYNFRVNVDAKIKAGLSTSIMVSGRQENRENPNTDVGTIMSAVLRNFPTYSPYVNGNKEYLAVTNQAHQHPLVLINKDLNGYNRQRNNVFDGTAILKYDAPFLKGLSAKAMYSHRITDINSKVFRKKYELYKFDEQEKKYVVSYTGNDPSHLSQRSWDNNFAVFQGSIAYKNTFFAKHEVEGLLLMETRETLNSSFNASREFLIDALDELFAGVDKNKNNDGSSSEDANIGYVGQFNYAYDKKYLLQFSFRYDGSAKFPKDSRWGFFPAISGGWVISRENFIRENIIGDIITNLKLRASWGRLGDDQASSFQHLTGYNYPSGNYIFGEDLTSALVSKGLANTKITWYTSDLTNIGLEFSLWKGLLSGEVDFFYRKRDGLLASRVASLPGTFGASLPQENLEGDSDRGYELVLNHQKSFSNGLVYRISANISQTRSKWRHTEQAAPIHQYDNWKNNRNDRMKNRWWGYEAIGQFQSMSEIASSPEQDGKGNKTLLPGDIKYLDLNNDGVIDGNDQKVIGRGQKPEVMLGFDFSIAWKGVDIGLFFQGATRFNAYFDNEMQSPFFNGASSLSAFTDRWHRTDPYDLHSTWIPGKYPSTRESGSDSNKKFSSFWMQNASYLRLKDVQVGYTFPSKWMKKIGIEYLRIFASGYNVFTITKLELLDPEAPTGRGLYYPQQKIFTFGVNLTL